MGTLDPISIYGISVIVIAGLITWFVVTHSEPSNKHKKK